jgi:hypothetical protein
MVSFEPCHFLFNRVIGVLLNFHKNEGQMADETKPAGENVEQVEEPTDTQPTQKAEKVTFTEAQQNHINSLLAAERKSAERKYQGKVDGAQSALDAQVDTVSFYEEKLKSIIEVQISDFDPVTKDLFTALPIREQLEKLSDEAFMAKIRSVTKAPKTPKANTEPTKPVFKRRQVI